MKALRRAARALAFETLFELESRPDRTLENALDDRLDISRTEGGQQLNQKSVDFARELVAGSLEHRGEIDARIGAKAPAFPVGQMPTTDRVALELALYEMLHARHAPPSVIINEAVELAKTYGGENSGRFVNGVLGTIAEELAG